MIQVWFAYLIDILIGDPRWLTHPVELIGKAIEVLEGRCLAMERTRLVRKVMGVGVVVIVVGGAYGLTWLAVSFAVRVHPVIGLVLSIWLIATTIAQRGLAKAAIPIADALARDDVETARGRVAMIVGRDTARSSEAEIARAATETVAENTVDGVTAPLFYGFLGGAPLAMAYRATNTLDSMLGYKNERYKDFGWAAARFDDLLNYVPSRLTGLLLPVAAWSLALNSKKAWQIMIRDASKHPSPNSGIMEAGFAGALGLTLGGDNYYQGQLSRRAPMGDGRGAINGRDLILAVKLMARLSLWFVITMGVLIWLVVGRVS